FRSAGLRRRRTRLRPQRSVTAARVRFHAWPDCIWRCTMNRLVLAAALLVASGTLAAQDLLLRNATVHTATDAGTLRATDVLVRNGRIAAIGAGLAAPAGGAVVEAEGRPLTPAMFGGITAIGIEEVSGEKPTVDATLTLGAGAQPVMTVRPEF